MSLFTLELTLYKPQQWVLRNTQLATPSILFWDTLVLNLSLHRRIKVTKHISNEKAVKGAIWFDSIQRIGFWCGHMQENWEKKYWEEGKKSLCFSSQAWSFLIKRNPLDILSSDTAAKSCHKCISLLASCSSQKIEFGKAHFSSNL